MTGAWRGGLSLSNAMQLGGVTASTGGTQILSPGSTFTKGVWAQLVASTGADSTWTIITLNNFNGQGGQVAVDVGYGASGSEAVVISNLNNSSNAQQTVTYQFPLMIPSGTRVAARCSADQTNFNSSIQMITFADTYASVGVGSAIDTYGYNTSLNLGTPVDPGGSANTKGAYAQITASTTADMAGFVLALDPQNDTTGNSFGINWLIDLAVGSSGNEVVIIPNMFQVGFAQGALANILTPTFPYIPIQIPAGTRIAIRAQSQITRTPDRIFGATLYGVRI